MARMIVSMPQALYDEIYRYVHQEKSNGKKITVSSFMSDLARKELGFEGDNIKQKGYVYFFQEDRHNTIKIGCSYSPDERLRRVAEPPYEVSCIHKIESKDMRKTESLFHDFFKFKKVNGEWFALQDNEIEWIKNGHYTPDIESSINGIA